MTSKPSVLIVGADSMIGRALAAKLNDAGHCVFETTRRAETVGARRSYLHLGNDVRTWTPPEAPQVSVLCAAVCSLSACERDPIGTAIVNVKNTLHLARKLSTLGSIIIYPSTNLVFAGDVPNQVADAPYRPACVYGRHKAEVETVLLREPQRAAVLRMTKIVSPGMPLISGWIDALRGGRTVRPLSDLLLSPLGLNYLIEALCRIITSGTTGVFQISGDRDVSYADIAGFIARRVGADPGLVIPVSSQDMGITLAAKSRHSTLDPSRAQAELGLVPPDAWSTIAATFNL